MAKEKGAQSSAFKEPKMAGGATAERCIVHHDREASFVARTVKGRKRLALCGECTKQAMESGQLLINGKH